MPKTKPMHQSFIKITKQLVALATFSLLIQLSALGAQKTKFPKQRPQHNPSCDTTFGFHHTCWRRIPSVPPCTSATQCGVSQFVDSQNNSGLSVPSAVPATTYSPALPAPVADSFFSDQPGSNPAFAHGTTARYGSVQPLPQSTSTFQPQIQHFNPEPIQRPAASYSQPPSPPTSQLPTVAPQPGSNQIQQSYRYPTQSAAEIPRQLYPSDNVSPASSSRYGLPVRMIGFPTSSSTATSRYGNLLKQNDQ